MSIYAKHSWLSGRYFISVRSKSNHKWKGGHEVGVWQGPKYYKYRMALMISGRNNMRMAETMSHTYISDEHNALKQIMIWTMKKT
jgi:hypothetical protein